MLKTRLVTFGSLNTTMLVGKNESLMKVEKKENQTESG